MTSLFWVQTEKKIELAFSLFFSQIQLPISIRIPENSISSSRNPLIIEFVSTTIFFKLFLNRLYLVTNIGFLLFPASIHHADNLTTVNKFNKTVVIFSVFLDECVYFLTNSESLIRYLKKISLKFFRWRRSLYGSFKQLLWRRY